MSSIHRVLFAVKEPTARRQPGLAKASELALRLGGTLELFHALSSPVFLQLQPIARTPLVDLERDERENCKRRLEKLAGPVRKRGVNVTCSAAWDYPPHEAIVRRAKTIGADLIVAETHKARHRHAWLLHLTDWELLRTSELPVLLLRSTKRWRNPKILAAIDPGHKHAKPLDLDARIIAGASELSEALGGRMHVAHAIHPSAFAIAVANSAFGAEPWGGEYTYAQLQRSDREDFEKFMAKTDVPRARRHLVDGNPGVQIPRLARSLKAAVVVMGAVSRSGLKRAFFGNTAERVLDSLACDVLIVKPHSFHQPVRAAPRGMRIVATPPIAAMPS